MSQINIYTDGSSLGNPGPGGWAAIILDGKKKQELFGSDPDTTNNRMEMQAVIEGLSYAKKKHPKAKLRVHSDSKLVIDTLTQGWKRKKNLDLWAKLDDLNEDLKPEWIKVKGHSDNKWNNECDRLAVAEAQKIKRVPTLKKPDPDVEFFCKNCQQEVAGEFTWMSKASLIRVDCEHCAKFVKFAKKTKENLKKVGK